MSKSPNLHLTSRLEHGVLVLELTDAEIRGDDLADELTKEFMAAVSSLENPKVVVDLQRITYTSSAGLRALLTLRRHLKEKGGQILLCGLSPAVTETMQSTRLATTSQSSVIPFTMVPDVSAAVAQLQ